MKNLVQYNRQILKQYDILEHQSSYAAPLLVSPKSIKYHPQIMYIGQETNTWYQEENLTVDDLEEYYNYFLKNNIPSSLFWKFVKNCFDLNNDNLYQNILWCNTLLCGKKEMKGTPIITKELLTLSKEYLIFLYQLFHPEYIMIVAGPNHPYYAVIKSFLEEIDYANLHYPTKNNMCQILDHVIWTYHPNYLNRTGKIKEIESNIRKIRKK